MGYSTTMASQPAPSPFSMAVVMEHLADLCARSANGKTTKAQIVGRLKEIYPDWPIEDEKAQTLLAEYLKAGQTQHLCLETELDVWTFGSASSEQELPTADEPAPQAPKEVLVEKVVPTEEPLKSTEFTSEVEADLASAFNSAQKQPSQKKEHKASKEEHKRRNGELKSKSGKIGGQEGAPSPKRALKQEAEVAQVTKEVEKQAKIPTPQNTCVSCGTIIESEVIEVKATNLDLSCLLSILNEIRAKKEREVARAETASKGTVQPPETAETPVELPKEAAEISKEVEEAPKELTESSKEVTEVQKEVPKEVAEVQKEVAEAKKEVPEAPKSSTAKAAFAVQEPVEESIKLCIECGNDAQKAGKVLQNNYDMEQLLAMLEEMGQARQKDLGEGEKEKLTSSVQVEAPKEAAATEAPAAESPAPAESQEPVESDVNVEAPSGEKKRKKRSKSSKSKHKKGHKKRSKSRSRKRADASDAALGAEKTPASPADPEAAAVAAENLAVAAEVSPMATEAPAAAQLKSTDAQPVPTEGTPATSTEAPATPHTEPGQVETPPDEIAPAESTGSDVNNVKPRKKRRKSKHRSKKRSGSKSKSGKRSKRSKKRSKKHYKESDAAVAATEQPAENASKEEAPRAAEA